MIAHLSGTLFSANDHFVIIDTDGVGYKVRVTAETSRSLYNRENKKVSLWIHTIVREDALDLYGFLNKTELDFFEMLISVSGIGPKSGLGILNISPVEHLKEAIINGNASALTKVAGIGSKNAQKIILELRDKLGGAGDETYGGVLHEERDAIEGLVALGYSMQNAREALKKVPADVTGAGNRIKQALKQLGK
ncbi:MAG: Holliday junction branch migration protein RuvA [Candidatus Yonathbacteria bacterium]|nr:Holliday junction branch migration protein RuvA [Candidatus Yonathbacteria bacterium]